MSEFHYLIIVSLITVIVIIQLLVYRKTKKKLALFSKIFPDKPYDEFLLIKNNDKDNSLVIVGKKDSDLENQKKNNKIQELKEEIATLEQSIAYDKVEISRALQEHDSAKHESLLLRQRFEKEKLQKLVRELEIIQNRVIVIPQYKSSNPVRNTIVSSINNYLVRNNSAASDFNLLKDIVDRNADASEDEIQNQIPVPLYCGLVGTMLGIIVGIGYLFQSGDINALLDASKEASGGAEGIKALLGGVALAMISSVFGIYLTTRGSWKSLKIKSQEEAGKHNFLSWMQAELLPVMNTDAASAMRTLVENLSNFNKSFASNTKSLNESLYKVSETTKDQILILDAIRDLNVNRIAAVNIEVYEKLKGCTQEIGKIGEYLHDSNEYLSQVRNLNMKLDDADQRSRMIEEMATYFKDERSNIDAISGMINRSMGEADAALQKSVEILRENVTKQNDIFVQHMVSQSERLSKVLDEQHRILEFKSSEMSKVISEMSQMTEVKKSMQRLEKVLIEQNRRMDTLIRSVSRVDKSVIADEMHKDDSNPMPLWLKPSLYCLGGMSFVIVLILIIKIFIKV